MPEKNEDRKDTGGANVEVNAQAFLDPNQPDPVLDEDGNEVKSKSDLDKGQESVLTPKAQKELEAAQKKAEKERLEAEKKAEEKALAEANKNAEAAKQAQKENR